MLNTPFSPWPSTSEDEQAAVQRVLASNRTNYWTGNEGKSFEREFAQSIHCQHAVAVANGTLALELALRATGVGPGDHVLVTPRTFLASASAIVMVGGIPVFADVDAESQNVTAETLSQALTPQTKAIVAVHLAGWPCEMSEIMAFAEANDIRVVEDCAQAHGASLGGRPVGSMGHVAAWSFCQDKILSSGGEGGMVTTNDPAIWSNVWSFKDHGKSWTAVYERDHPPGFRWLHESFGSNYRMPEMQASIGRVQLAKLPLWHERRRAHAEQIITVAGAIAGLRAPRPNAQIEHGWYKCYLFVEPDALKPEYSRDRIMREINELGVPCYSGSCSEIYLEKAFDNTGWRPQARLPVARLLGETSLMFLVHPTLTSAELSQTCEAIEKVCNAAQR